MEGGTTVHVSGLCGVASTFENILNEKYLISNIICEQFNMEMMATNERENITMLLSSI